MLRACVRVCVRELHVQYAYCMHTCMCLSHVLHVCRSENTIYEKLCNSIVDTLMPADKFKIDCVPSYLQDLTVVQCLHLSPTEHGTFVLQSGMQQPKHAAFQRIAA